jgi:hypothetical protein
MHGTPSAFISEPLHARDAILGAERRGEPFEHVYVERLFSPWFYDALLAHFPNRETFRRQSRLDPAVFVGNHDRRLEIRFPDGLDWLTPAQRRFWVPFSDFLCGRDFAGILIERFAPYFRARFGAAIDEFDFVEHRMRGAFMLSRHDPDYYLGPHTDLAEKIVTCIFYMPETRGLDHLGTSLYAPLDRTFVSDGNAHHDPAQFERVSTLPFRPNSAFIFARSGTSFHGVERFTPEALAGSSRAGFQLSFYTR